ncbi:MAG: hypothetical protein HOP15_15925, partial [Planctomycetes bacterium]|nr:hypothetical protein [Planctomycetota bacterium]
MTLRQPTPARSAATAETEAILLSSPSLLFPGVEPRNPLGSVGFLAAGALLLAALVAPVAGQVTRRVSVSTGGAQANGESVIPSISADGRYVAFVSSASNLVAGDTNATDDVFVRDRLVGATERVSIDSLGVESNSYCMWPSISADGRYAAFVSSASNLVAGDTNATDDVFVRDRWSGTTERVSVDSLGMEANGYCMWPSISADGRYAAFVSSASNLVVGDTNATDDVFVHDRWTGATERVSVDSGGAQA